MTPGLFLLICVAGGIGAGLRFIVDGSIKARTGGGYPWGTTVINVSGSLLLGLVTGLAVGAILPEELRLIIGGGFLGGYTTFSTASFETIRLAQDKRAAASLANGIGMLVASVAAAAAGLALAFVLSGVSFASWPTG